MKVCSAYTSIMKQNLYNSDCVKLCDTTYQKSYFCVNHLLLSRSRGFCNGWPSLQLWIGPNALNSICLFIVAIQLSSLTNYSSTEGMLHYILRNLRLVIKVFNSFHQTFRHRKYQTLSMKNFVLCTCLG